ncbi:MAG: hypothetical protein OXC11_12335, partial [Rhodospirillales bacterium]|nr:hypothetical protein [Rhodospirillales bacterium]
PTPPNPGTPPDSACALVGGGASRLDGCACPPNFSDAPWAGIGRKIEKVRWIWLQPIPNRDEMVGREHRQENSHADFGTRVGRTSGYGWGQNKRRFHPNPGGGWNADCVQNSERDYSNCYRIDTVACGSAEALGIGATTAGNSEWTGYVIDHDNDGNPDDKWDGAGDPPDVDNHGDPLNWLLTTFIREETGEVQIRVWSNSAGTGERLREEFSNNCAYSASAMEGGCNWSDTDGDGGCDD